METASSGDHRGGNLSLGYDDVVENGAEAEKKKSTFSLKLFEMVSTESDEIVGFVPEGDALKVFLLFSQTFIGCGTLEEGCSWPHYFSLLLRVDRLRTRGDSRLKSSQNISLVLSLMSWSSNSLRYRS